MSPPNTLRWFVVNHHYTYVYEPDTQKEATKLQHDLLETVPDSMPLVVYGSLEAIQTHFPDMAMGYLP